ncbi:hypothetical protein PsorP6_015259 [Peronosclerospora sorghi]|uniref:Uncharacterized protein n=1 Tax=Peronosclerospora sorghi TaxID=230839 RepID=A0ACC0VSH9_9STRA|nr:hypothetical protein PsorP6_015259 [Peronosclerospora sorghi]
MTHPKATKGPHGVSQLPPPDAERVASLHSTRALVAAQSHAATSCTPHTPSSPPPLNSSVRCPISTPSTELHSSRSSLSSLTRPHPADIPSIVLLSLPRRRSSSTNAFHTPRNDPLRVASIPSPLRLDVRDAHSFFHIPRVLHHMVRQLLHASINRPPRPLVAAWHFPSVALSAAILTGPSGRERVSQLRRFFQTLTESPRASVVASHAQRDARKANTTDACARGRPLGGPPRPHGHETRRGTARTWLIPVGARDMTCRGVRGNERASVVGSRDVHLAQIVDVDALGRVFAERRGVGREEILELAAHISPDEAEPVDFEFLEDDENNGSWHWALPCDSCLSDELGMETRLEPSTLSLSVSSVFAEMQIFALWFLLSRSRSVVRTVVVSTSISEASSAFTSNSCQGDTLFALSMILASSCAFKETFRGFMSLSGDETCTILVSLTSISRSYALLSFSNTSSPMKT